MEQYLINEGSKNLIFEAPTTENKINQINKQELIKLINLSKEVQKLINQLTRRIDNKLIIEQAAVIAAFKTESIKNPKVASELAKYLELRLNTIEGKIWKVAYNEEKLTIIKTNKGVSEKYTIDEEFLITPEAKLLNEMRKTLMNNFGILKNGSAGTLRVKDSEFKINGPLDLIDKVLEIGKLGAQINRYKGLGEMNPEQLWETTLDKNYRSLLDVKLDEVNEANSIFETLMGDITEGRKNFIQENSLRVANLDI